MKKKIFLTLFIGVFTIVASIFSAYTLINRKGGEVSVSLSGRKAVVGRLEAKSLTLYPGSFKEYSMKVECNETGDYLFSFQLEEKKDGGLKPFVTAELYLSDERIAYGTVEELLQSEEFEKQLVLNKGDETVIRVKYSMDISVTDEAQGTSASVDVIFRATKIGE